MSSRDPVYTSNTTIPCSSDCAYLTAGHTAHSRVACAKCRELFDHRVLIDTLGKWTCPPCSRAKVQSLEDRDQAQFSTFFLLVLVFIFGAICCSGLSASSTKPHESSVPAHVEVSK